MLANAWTKGLLTLDLQTFDRLAESDLESREHA
jgi:hypothetical protein